MMMIALEAGALVRVEALFINIEGYFLVRMKGQKYFFRLLNATPNTSTNNPGYILQLRSAHTVPPKPITCVRSTTLGMLL
jgi:hypothetical protein